MKNFINYYYNLNIDNIYFKAQKYYFKVDNTEYILKLCNNLNFQSYYENLNYQLRKYKWFFEVAPNKDKNLITLIEGKSYVLLKIKNIKNEIISIFDIKTDMYINLSNDIMNLNHFPWIKLWESKIDYMEDWFDLKKDKYLEILPIFNYFVGISENALLYLKETEIEEQKEYSDNPVISHNRITVDYELFDYYDPTNVIIDHPSRDVSEYVKSSFISKTWDLDMLKSFLRKHYFSKYGLRMLYARIIFPSFFFDSIERAIFNNENIEILQYEKIMKQFNVFLKEVSDFFIQNYNIKAIPWIIKKT